MQAQNTTIIADALRPAEQQLHEAELLRQIRDQLDRLAAHREEVARDQLGDLINGDAGEQLISTVRETHCEQIADMPVRELFDVVGNKLGDLAAEVDNTDPDGPDGPGGPGGGKPSENADDHDSESAINDDEKQAEPAAASADEQDDDQAAESGSAEQDQDNDEKHAGPAVPARDATDDDNDSGGSGTDDLSTNKTGNKLAKRFFNFGPDADRQTAAKASSSSTRTDEAETSSYDARHGDQAGDVAEAGHAVEPLPDDDGRPSHHRVYDALRRLIEAGEIAPKNARIAEIANCKPGTVGAALSKLTSIRCLDHGENGYRYQLVQQPDELNAETRKGSDGERIQFYDCWVPSESKVLAEAIVGEAYEDAGDDQHDGSNPYAEQGGWKEAVYRAAYNEAQTFQKLRAEQHAYDRVPFGWRRDENGELVLDPDHVDSNGEISESARRELEAQQNDQDQDQVSAEVSDTGSTASDAASKAGPDPSEMTYSEVRGETVPAAEEDTARNIVVEATDDAADLNHGGENPYRSCRGKEAWKRRLYKRVYNETRDSMKQNGDEADETPSSDAATGPAGAGETSEADHAAEADDGSAAEADGDASGSKADGVPVPSFLQGIAGDKDGTSSDKQNDNDNDDGDDDPDPDPGGGSGGGKPAGDDASSDGDVDDAEAAGDGGETAPAASSATSTSSAAENAGGEGTAAKPVNTTADEQDDIEKPWDVYKGIRIDHGDPVADEIRIVVDVCRAVEELVSENAKFRAPEIAERTKLPLDLVKLALDAMTNNPLTKQGEEARAKNPRLPARAFTEIGVYIQGGTLRDKTLEGGPVGYKTKLERALYHSVSFREDALRLAYLRDRIPVNELPDEDFHTLAPEWWERERTVDVPEYLKDLK